MMRVEPAGLRCVAPDTVAVAAAPEAFLKDDVRVHPELDGLGCLGDLVRHALYVSSCTRFQHVCTSVVLIPRWDTFSFAWMLNASLV